MQIAVTEGRRVLHDCASALDELHDAVGAPVTARRPWLQAWIDSYPVHTPALVTVSAPDGQLLAAAALASRRRAGVHQVLACGHGPSDAVTFPARDQAAAGALSTGVVTLLRRLSGPWTLTLRHVTPETALLTTLGSDVRGVRVVPGDRSPQLHAEAGPLLRDYVSSSHRKGINRIRNRMANQGLDPQVAHERDADIVMDLLPEIERVYRARDRAVPRACPLDDPDDRHFFRTVVQEHAARGQLELTTVHLQDRLAAYVICFLETGVARMWNCRFDPAFDRYSPGKLAIDESIAHALADGVRTYDFMRGLERYKASYATGEMQTQDVYAASNMALRAGRSTMLVARERARAVGDSDGAGGRAVQAVRRARDRWGLP